MKTKRTDLLHIPFGQIAYEEGFNVRYDYGDIKSLAESIKENGVKVPIRVKKERGKDLYILTDGHRRLKAVQYAVTNLGMEEPLVPAILEKVGVTKKDRILSLIILNDGKSLTMLEEAMVYKRLIDEENMTQADISRIVGKSKMHISNCISLLKAPEDVLERVKAGELSATFVVESLKDGDIDKIQKLPKGVKVTKKQVKPQSKKLDLKWFEGMQKKYKGTNAEDVFVSFQLFLGGKLSEEDLVNVLEC